MFVGISIEFVVQTVVKTVVQEVAREATRAGMRAAGAVVQNRCGKQIQEVKK